MKPLSAKQQFEISELFLQGQRAVQLSQFDQAETAFLKILKINTHLIEARAFLAFVYSATQQHAKATKELRQLLQSGINVAQTHHNLANSLFEQKLFDEAVSHYQSAIRLEPSRVESYIHCGIALRMLHKHEAAMKYLYDALNQDKRNSRAFHVLGMIFVDIQDYPRALECLGNAVGLSPNEPQYRVSFAETLKKAGLDFEAGVELHRTCELNPTYTDSFIGYGQYLLDHHRYDEAAECLQHANQLSPDNLDVLDKLGEVYTGLGNIELALKFYDQALLRNPSHINSLVGKGQTYLELGDSSKATEIGYKAIQIDNAKPHGLLLLSRSKKSQSNDGLIDSLLRFAKDEYQDKEAKIAVNFALGKVYDDQNNFLEAFNYYSAGNALKNSQLNYSLQSDIDVFDRTINFFDKSFFTTYQHLGTDSKLPIIIVGMPRSGTTLTEQIISSHPKIIGAGEVVFWGKSSSALPLRIGSKAPYPECIADLSITQAADIAYIYESTLSKIAGPKTNAKHITDKMPHNFLNLGLIALLFPHAKIIHTKRNPIDTCLSIFFQNFNSSHSYAFNLENLGHHYKQYERIMRHWHEVLPGRIMDIHYEDTISDPEYWSRKLIEHIGVEWDDACLAPHKLERTVKTASHWQVRQPIYKTSVQRWKNYEPFLGDLIEALKD